MPELDLQRPEAFSSREIDGGKLLNTKLHHLLDGELTEISLARLFRAHGENLHEAEERLFELKTHERAFGYNTQNVLHRCDELKFVRKVFERFSISNVRCNHFSGDFLVFIQKMKNVDLKEILQVLPAGTILNAYVLLQTIFDRAIKERERQIGRRVAVITIIDLQGLALKDFANPFSASSQFARLVSKIWSDYFSEHLVRLYLIHPPGLLSLMWHIAKHILDPKTQSRVQFLTKIEELGLHLSKDSIPKIYGGTRVDNSGFSENKDSCVSSPLQVNSKEYFNLENFWHENGICKPFPEYKTVILKPKSIHEEKIDCLVGQKLVWTFNSTADIIFEIVFKSRPSLNINRTISNETDENQNQLDTSCEENVWPRLTVMSLKIPEHGVITCLHNGVYIFRYSNPSIQTKSWLPSSNPKVQYANRVVSKTNLNENF